MPVLYPTDKAYPRGAKYAKLIKAYDKETKTNGDGTCYARALLGRLLYFYKCVPQKNSTNIESIAWHRASGAQPGYWNRTQRKKRSYVDN